MTMDTSSLGAVPNCSTPESILTLKHVCTTGSEPPDECFPDLTRSLEIFAGIWAVIVSTLGFFGNLLNVCAVAYAANNNRYGFNRNWNTTKLLLNLSLADMILSIVSPPFAATFFLSDKEIPLGAVSCYVVAAGRHIVMFVVWLNLGIIALFRCMVVVWPETSQTVMSSNVTVNAILMFIWIYGAALPASVYSGVGTFGYNCGLGCCDFIIDPSYSRFVQTIFLNISFGIPFLLIGGSYSIILASLWKSTSFLRSIRPEKDEELNRKEVRLTVTILFVCLSFAAFVLPLTMLNVFDPDSRLVSGDTQLCIRCWYWCHLVSNVLIYAYRSKHCRMAYKEFLWEAFYLVTCQ